VNVYVEGEDVRTKNGLDTPVDETSQIILLPAMAGGAMAVTPENAAHFPRG
jgi:molybdopterin converting factor small subunit